MLVGVKMELMLNIIILCIIIIIIITIHKHFLQWEFEEAIFLGVLARYNYYRLHNFICKQCFLVKFRTNTTF